MAKAAAYQCERLGIKVILHDDIRYPESLRQIADPPFLLFVRGNEKLLTGQCVSVVGTRRLSTAGRTAARAFAYEAANDSDETIHYSDLPPEARDVLINATVRLKIYN